MLLGWFDVKKGMEVTTWSKGSENGQNSSSLGRKPCRKIEKKRERIQPLEPDQLEASLQSGFRSIEGRGDNLYLTLLRHPELHLSRLGFGRYLQGESLLPVRDREVVILRVAWLCRSPYVWGRHVQSAQRAGLNFQDIARVCKGEDAEGWKPFQSVLIRVVNELMEQYRVSDDTWNSLSVNYSEQQLMDLVFTIGGYQMMAMATNSFGIEPEPGDEPLPHAQD